MEGAVPRRGLPMSMIVEGEKVGRVPVSHMATSAVGEAECDVLVLARGGGAAEDLSPFDDARLAEAWMDHPAYTISAVGHAENSCLTDVLADAACPTPSMAGAFVAQKAREAAEASSDARAAAERDRALRELAASRRTTAILAAVLVVLALAGLLVVAW